MRVLHKLFWMAIFAFSSVVPALCYAKDTTGIQLQAARVKHKHSSHSHHSRSVSSSSSCDTPPENFAITHALTNPSKMFQRGQLYEFYENLAYDNHLYALWADNSKSQPYCFGTNLLFRKGKIKSKHGKTKIEFSDIQIALPVDTAISSANECSFTINPANPKNLVFTAAVRTNTNPSISGANNYDTYRGVTTDGGENLYYWTN